MVVAAAENHFVEAFEVDQIDEAVAVTAVATHLNSSWDWEGRSLVPNATRCQP